MIITIDGPAGTGKTTIARKVAEKLGYLYFDTGAMYRSATYLMLKENIDLEDKTRVSSFLEQFKFTIRSERGGKRYFVDSEDVTDLIRTSEITKHVSAVSSLTAVRETLVAIQRDFGQGTNSIFEGRDMGTVVFPKADVKVFLTARPAVRAERRYLELKDQSLKTTEEVMQELLKRDHFDSTREISPLKQAEDAHLIDTSDLTIDEVVEQILDIIPKASS